MSNRILLTQLRLAKARLGRLVFLDYTSGATEDAHQSLGAEVKLQVHKILRDKFDHMEKSLLLDQVRQVRSCYAILAERSNSKKISPPIRSAIAEYLRCLDAWSSGAELSTFYHPALSKFTFDRKHLTALDLALLLQHDNAGCQTGIYRQLDGSVILWHTEEDGEGLEGGRFDKLRILSLKVQDGASDCVDIHAFIYPDLLPGPAFAWRSDGFVQAVDSLLLKPNLLKNGGVLANVASWLTLRLGHQAKPEEVLQALQPYFDGYALNTIGMELGRVHASKYEFFADRIIPYVLPEEPGSYLFQVNVFTQQQGLDLLNQEKLSAEERKVFEDRVQRTRRILRRNESDASSPQAGMKFFKGMVASRSGNEWGYSNPDVKAWFISRVASNGTEIWLGNGPPLPGDQPLDIHIDG